MRGKVSDVFQKIPLYNEHPRLCGEKSQYVDGSQLRQGSPPPMRGKALFPFIFPVVGGITPAYAGKSL